MPELSHAAHAADLDTPDVTQCFVDAWSYISGQYPDAILAQVGPVAVTLSQTICPFFNMITISGRTNDEAALRQAIATARGYAERCPHDAMLLVSPDWLPERGAEILAHEGLSYSMSMWGMATDGLAPPRRDEPALEYRIADDAASSLDLGRVNADAYGMPHEIFAVTGNLHEWSGTQFGVVGYGEGRAVAAAQAYLLKDCIYIAMVATLPDLHGKGFGEATMRRAIAAAQDAVGHKRLWLHATASGRPLYRSMGFDDGAQLDLYSFGGHA